MYIDLYYISRRIFMLLTNVQISIFCIQSYTNTLPYNEQLYLYAALIGLLGCVNVK